MKGRRANVLVALTLALIVPLTTAGHTDDLRLAGSAQVSSHDHGPFGHCAVVKQHQCVACHATALFGPLPDADRVAPPTARRALWKHPQRVESRAAAPQLVGRSPPALQAI